MRRNIISRLATYMRREVGRKLNTPSYNIVTPGIVSPVRSVPSHITKPPYVTEGHERVQLSEPEIKTTGQIESMWNSCKLARHVMDKVAKSLKVGMTTDEIDVLVHNECVANNAYPSPLLYKGFPKSVCTSINNIHCHGIPDDRPLQDGDILNVDISVYYRGYHGDTSETFLIGNVDEAGRQLVKVGKECLQQGINVCKPGARFCDIGKAICKYANAQGFSVIPEITGHGIGSYFHGPPSIFHVDYETEESMAVMKPGMIFTIEPVICEGSDQFEKWSDKWTLASLDDSRSCQFEHTVLIVKSGVEIMTKWYYDDYGDI
ncbi:Methionine aminopeptidase 1D [Mactra antiquata]